MNQAEHRRQSETRKQKRQNYIDKLTSLRRRMDFSSSFVKEKDVAVNQQSSEDLEEVLMEENKKLQDQWRRIQAQSDFPDFSSKISQIKQLSMVKIKQIHLDAKEKKERDEEETKIVSKQIQKAIEKNRQLEKDNDRIKQELDQCVSMMGKYTTEIRNEYSKKIVDFQQIYESSSERINEMETEEKSNDFIDSVLKDEDLMKTILANSDNAEDFDKMIEDYQELLNAKNEIVVQLNSNLQMKKGEIVRMSEIETKMKDILEQLKDEKDIYLIENRKMYAELMEVKELLTKTMSSQ